MITKNAALGALALGASALALLCFAWLALPPGTPSHPVLVRSAPAGLEKTSDCYVDGCGSPAPPPSDPSVCKWDTEPSGVGKPPGCAYCKDSQCVNKLPSGTPAGNQNDCQSNSVVDGMCSSCYVDGCGSPAPPPSDPSICRWDTEPSGVGKPAGCAFCMDGQCVNKLPIGSPAGDQNDCQSNFLTPDNTCTAGCYVDGCGSPATPPSDPSVCKWDTEPSGVGKPPGCAYCKDNQCVNKLPNGSPAGDQNDCQSNFLTSDNTCTAGCYVDGCGSPATPPSDPSVCDWDTEPSGVGKPAGCAYCQDNQCVNKLPNGSPTNDANVCQSNTVYERTCQPATCDPIINCDTTCSTCVGADVVTACQDEQKKPALWDACPSLSKGQKREQKEQNAADKGIGKPARKIGEGAEDAAEATAEVLV